MSQKNVTQDKAARLRELQEKLKGETLQTAITYSVGLLSKPVEGILSYDGNGLLELTDVSTKAKIFSVNISDMVRVTRAEYAIYVTIPGMKKIALLFGDSRKYVLTNGIMMPLGITGAAIALMKSNQMNQASGLTAWVLLFRAYGKIRNMSPNSVLIFAIIGGIAITIVSFAIYVMIETDFLSDLLNL